MTASDLGRIPAYRAIARTPARLTENLRRATASLVSLAADGAALPQGPSASV